MYLSAHGLSVMERESLSQSVGRACTSLWVPRWWVEVVWWSPWLVAAKWHMACWRVALCDLGNLSAGIHLFELILEKQNL